MIKYLLAWFPMIPIAIVNGILRQYGYEKHLGELRAHQLSTLIGLLLFGAYIAGVIGLFPPDSAGQAMGIGLLWLVLTIGFEFGFGRYVAGHSWNRLLSDYNLLAGRLWVLVLAWLAGAPYLFYALLG